MTRPYHRRAERVAAGTVYLAAAVGISFARAQRIETGGETPPPSLARRIRQYIDRLAAARLERSVYVARSRAEALAGDPARSARRREYNTAYVRRRRQEAGNAQGD